MRRSSALAIVLAGIASPTSTTSPTPGAIPFPAEVKESGIEAPGAFADAHDARLRNTSFTARYSRVRTEDGLVDARLVGVLRYDGDGSAYYNYTTVDPSSTTVRRIVVWSKGTTTRRAITDGNATSVREGGPISIRPTFAKSVETYLRSFETDVTGYSWFGGDTTVRISGSAFNHSENWSAAEELAARSGSPIRTRADPGDLKSVVAVADGRNRATATPFWLARRAVRAESAPKRQTHTTRSVSPFGEYTSPLSLSF